MKNLHDPSPLSDHIFALKRALLVAIFLFLTALFAIWPFSKEALHLFLAKVEDPQWKKELIIEEKWTNVAGESIVVKRVVPKIMALAPTELLYSEIRLTIEVAGVLSFPFILLPIFSFLWPALFPREKKIATALYFQAIFSTMAALLITWKWTFPWLLTLCQTMGEGSVFSLYSLRELLDFFETVVLLHLFLIQCFFLFLTLIGFQLIDERALRAKRKEALLSFFIVGAIITPPDIVSQLAVALPLWGLYELLLVIGFFLRKRASIFEHEHR